MSSNNYYGNVYAQGGFRGLEMGLEYLMNRDNLAAQAESDRIRNRNDMVKAEMDDTYRNKALDVEASNLSKLSDNDRLQIENQYKSDMAATMANLEAARIQAGATERVGMANAAAAQTQADAMQTEASSVANVNNATADSTRAQTDMTVSANENENAAKVVAQLNSIIQLNGWTREEAAQQPIVKDTLRVLVGSSPRRIAAVNEQHKLTTVENPLKEIGNSGRYAIVGTSDVNGKPTVATAKNETLADGGTDGALVEDVDTMFAQAYAMAYKGGYQDQATLDLLTSTADETGLGIDDIADPRVVHKAIKDNTAPPPEVGNESGVPLRAAGNDAQAAAADAATSPPPASTKAPAPARSSFRNQLTAINALHGSNPDRVTDFASGRGANQAEADMSRKEEARDNKAAREDIADERKAQREERAERLKHMRTNPNADLKNASERATLMAESDETTARLGVNDSFRTFDFGKDIGFFDQPAETWLADGESSKDRAEYAFNDVKTTVTNNQEKFEQALGKPLKKWGRAEWRKAGEITKLSREGDRLNSRLQPDTNTFGQLNEDAIREFKKGNILNTRAK